MCGTLIDRRPSANKCGWSYLDTGTIADKNTHTATCHFPHKQTNPATAREKQMLQKYFENGKETLIRFGWIETPPFHSRDCERTICLDDKPPIPPQKLRKNINANSPLPYGSAAAAARETGTPATVGGSPGAPPGAPGPAPGALERPEQQTSKFKIQMSVLYLFTPAVREFPRCGAAPWSA